MKKKAVIIDFKLGNLYSVVNACKFLGYNTLVTSNYKEVEDANYLIMPGVGAFGDAMDNLTNLNLIEPIKNHVAKEKPLFGICLGMQLLFSKSEESPGINGFNIIPGVVNKFPVQTINNTIYKVPKVQWNNLVPTDKSWELTPFKDLKAKDLMYFVHSFYVQPQDPANILSQTTYGNINYCSAICKENIIATQFHPEKSGEAGIQILNNWFKL